MDEALEAFALQLLEHSTREPDGSARLLPERELCERLSVSRGALRERLSQLESIGILRRIQGHGSYISTPDVSFVRTYFTLMRALGFLTSTEFAEAREMLETIVTVQAARGAGPQHADALRELVDAMVAATASGDEEAALEADMAFHSMLFTIVDNPIFTMLSDALSHVLHDTIRDRRASAMRTEQPDADGTHATDTVHHGIVDALAAGDPDAARIAIEQHFVVHSLITGGTTPPAASDTPGAPS